MSPGPLLVYFFTPRLIFHLLPTFPSAHEFVPADSLIYSWHVPLDLPLYIYSFKLLAFSISPPSLSAGPHEVTRSSALLSPSVRIQNFRALQRVLWGRC